MEKVFVDPLMHSREVESFQVALMMFLFGCGLVGLFTFWYFSGAPLSKLGDYLIMASVLVAGMGITYYMLKRNRRAHADHTWFSVSEEGIKSRTVSGLIEVSWEEVEEIRIADRPSSNRTADVLIRTSRGYIQAMMRFMEKKDELPEPRLLKPGRVFSYPDKSEVCISPETSELVTALREYAPAGIIKEGVLISL
ncbi:MAG: hypothetical protein R6V10_08610 [bacterium]